MKRMKKSLLLQLPNCETRFNSEAKEIILPFAIEYPQEGIIITVPKGGDKKKLLELSEKNVNYYPRRSRKEKNACTCKRKHRKKD